MNRYSGILIFGMLLSMALFTGCSQGKNDGRRYNDSYHGEYLNHIAFPLGGIGAGMVCVEGTGALSHVSLRNKPEIFKEPCAFAAISIKGIRNGAKLLEGQVPTRKLFGGANTGNGLGGTSYGLPRFEKSEFLARFPFGIINLYDKDIPVKVQLTAWSPFIPTDEDNSSLPVAAIEYSFENPTQKNVEAVFSWNARNFMRVNRNNSIKPLKNGFILHQGGSKEHPEQEGDFAVFVDDNNVKVNHCWFRGGWWDPLTKTWNGIEKCEIVENDPVANESPGASLFVPFNLEPGEKKTIRLMFVWFVPASSLRLGTDALTPGPAFGEMPSKGTAPDQQEVSGFLGKGLVNTFDPDGDRLTGTLTSPQFKLNGNYLRFLIGGGSHSGSTCINLLLDGEVVRTATGNNDEMLLPHTWDVTEYRGKTVRIRIVDEATMAWGHINVDQIIVCDDPKADLSTAAENPAVTLLHDFEGNSWNGWKRTGPKADEEKFFPVEGCVSEEVYYKSWYAGRFAELEDVVKYWRLHYDDLFEKTQLFTESFFRSTLPPEVLEAVAANLTILKSPTVLRQADGRLWCFEGCSDNWGSCHGSCTHVWNYAQAIPHIFPALERTLRETEFFVSQNEQGHQTFRTNLPIRPVAHTFHAASDGQLGGIMKVYRDWRISGDSTWLKKIFPKVKESLDYCIEVWDPEHIGVLIEPHHNTYDIEFWGPDGMCTSFYLGALSAYIRMANVFGQPVQLYQTLLDNGRQYLEDKLFNGEYFYQRTQWEGLKAENPVEALASRVGTGYFNEAYELLKQEGPKYQYGTGCLSDGILGMWIASVCGLEEPVDQEKVADHLKAVYKYNLKHNLRDHPNPQRPTFACGNEGGLLLCTWPEGDQPTLPFVYSNEVWTGIEYQVASHLMMKGLVEEGLDIVRTCRDRYDGCIRNPFDEYECGHWYARALASYGLLQGLTGVRYDAVDKILFIDSRIGDDFTSFLSTETGFGNVGLDNGKPFVDVKMGKIDIEEVIVGE